MQLKEIISALLLGITAFAAPSPLAQAQTQQSESSVQSALRELRDSVQRSPAAPRPAADPASPREVRAAPKPCAQAEGSCVEGPETSTLSRKPKR